MLQKKGDWGHVSLAIIAVGLAFGVIFLLQQNSPSFLTGFATAQVGNLSAGVATYLSCTWSDPSLAISFGSNLNPGTAAINASLNYNSTLPGNISQYNVTVDTLSNVQANITIRGDHLLSGANIIGITNVTWASNITAPNGTNMISPNGVILTGSYNTATPVGANRPVASQTFFRMWLSIPNGAVAGTYVGNYTMQCAQAS